MQTPQCCHEIQSKTSELGYKGKHSSYILMKIIFSLSRTLYRAKIKAYAHIYTFDFASKSFFMWQND